MGLLDTILKAGSGKTQSALGQQFGLKPEQVKSALGQLVPALSAGVRRNTQDPAGLEALVGAVSKGNHQQYLDNPEKLQDPETVNDGNAILGHLLGSKEASREVASQASEKTGIDAGILKKMLPLAATMLMGSIGKSKAAFSKEGRPSAGLLGSLLDRDGDGSIADDVLGGLKKLF